MSYEKDFIVSKYEWPYPMRYDVENTVTSDVLVLGGGIAGCWAAISAARRGANVVMAEKISTIKSGAGGSGVDHWQCTTGNPACNVTAEELARAINVCHGGWDCGIHRYIECRDSYDTLLEIEQMGAKIRDTEDEFKGAEFRDENTKLLFAYDYKNKYTNRVWGTTFKPALYSECKRLGVNIYDRVMATSLLTAGGRQGARVVGATGVNVRTGEFYTFGGKATVLCLSRPERMWIFSTEYTGLEAFNPNVCVGDGHAMAWNAGAELTLMEKTRPPSRRGQGTRGPFGYPAYGTGNAGNTWYACTMVDATGKEIPWVDRDGNILTSVSQRYRPASGQKFFVMGGGLTGVGGEQAKDFQPPRPLISRGSGQELVEEREFTLPLYADLPSMPEHERRAIFGLMVGQEGRTWILYRNLTQAGFDPDQDMLQSYFMISGGPTTWRTVGFNSGGLVVDWDLKTSLEGLYAAGQQVLTAEDHAGAATMGRWAGAKAADYAAQAAEPVIHRGQVDAEKARVYAPLQRTEGMEWKEFNAGISRVMQEWCGEWKSEELLTIGLTWLQEIREKEAGMVYARNPHELMRVLECYSILTVAEVMMHAGLSRKASSSWLSFYRLDYPEMDPPEWNKYITIRLDGKHVKTGELPLDYYLKPPNAPTLRANYERHKPW